MQATDTQKSQFPGESQIRWERQGVSAIFLAKKDFEYLLASKAINSDSQWRTFHVFAISLEPLDDVTIELTGKYQ